MQDKNISKTKKILLALALYVKVKGIRGLAKYLDINESSLYTWINRDSIGDTGAIAKKIPNVRIEWLETGEGEMFVTPITGTSKERLSFSEKSVGVVGESPHEQTIRQRLGSYNYSPEVWAMADFLDLMTKNMTAEEREAFARELFEDTVRKLRAGEK